MQSPERNPYAPPGAVGSEHEQQPAAPLVESLNRLEEAVSKIHDSETFRRYLEAQSRFHQYSWGNVLLILLQRPDATRIAGYRTWRSMGRYVRRGERGIRIIVPYSHRHEPEFEDQEPTVFTCFRSGAVFDISQTEGAPLPEVQVPELQGNQGLALFRKLETLAILEGLKVRRGHARLTGEMMGFYEPGAKAIFLREASLRQMTKTLAHELAHHFGGGTSSNPEEETCAEAVAYVVCARFGLDTGERSFPYIASWSREPKTLKAAMTRVQAISALMIDRLGAEQTEATIRL
jgi:antirestriction protein ArdC